MKTIQPYSRQIWGAHKSYRIISCFASKKHSAVGLWAHCWPLRAAGRRWVFVRSWCLQTDTSDYCALMTAEMTSSSSSSASSPSSTSRRTHYIVLAVPNTASCDEIKKA